MDKDTRDILKKIEDEELIPPLSATGMKLMDMASREDIPVSELAKVIEKDPALTLRLIRIANSSFFGAASKVSTIYQAIVRLGFERVRLMALSLSIRDAFPFGKRGNIDYGTFWRLSLYRGLIAKSISEYLSMGNPQEAFVAGLILEIGYILFHRIFIKDENSPYPHILEPLKEILRWQKKRYGVNHRELAQVALKRWNFPESYIYCQAIYGKRAKEDDFPDFVKICESARILSIYLVHYGEDLLFEDIYISIPIEMESEVLNRILINTFQEVEGTAKELKIQVNREKDIMELLEKANKTLLRISQKMTDMEDKLPTKKLPSLEYLYKSEVDPATIEAIAHEIRNPLLAVGGFARRLLSVMDPDSIGAQYAEVILKEAERLEEALKKIGAASGITINNS